MSRIYFPDLGFSVTIVSLRVKLFFVIGMIALSVPYAQKSTSVVNLRAAYLVRFLSMVHWESLPTDKLDIEFKDSYTVGALVKEIYDVKTLNNRPVHVGFSNDTLPCGNVIIYGNESGHTEDLTITTCDSMNSLLIGYEKDFIERGGDVAIYLEGAHMRFNFNPEKMRNKGITINAFLMNYVKNIRKERSR